MTLLLGLGSGVGVLVVSWLLVAMWIRVSIRARIIDQPTYRSSHTVATPRGGGTGIVVSCGLVLGLAAIFGPDTTGHVWAPLAFLAALVATVSFIDDVRSLSSIVRLCLHLSAAVGVVVVLGPIREIAVPLAGVITLPAWLAWMASVVWIAGLTNVYNFMDGIDGIAGGQGVVSGLAWLWFGLATGSSVLAWMGLTVAATCAGFLIHNWSPARVFMGDVGSAFLGFVLAMCPLIAAVHPGSIVGLVEADALPVFAVLTVWPFVADGVFTFLRRVKHRENVLKAHRSHLYQRLTIAGWTHGHVSTLYVAWATVGAGLGGLYLVSESALFRLAVLLGSLLSLVAMYGFVKGQERRRSCAQVVAPRG